MNTAPRRKPDRKSPFRRLGRWKRPPKPDSAALAPPSLNDADLAALESRWFGEPSRPQDQQSNDATT